MKKLIRVDGEVVLINEISRSKSLTVDKVDNGGSKDFFELIKAERMNVVKSSNGKLVYLDSISYGRYEVAMANKVKDWMVAQDLLSVGVERGFVEIIDRALGDVARQLQGPWQGCGVGSGICFYRKGDVVALQGTKQLIKKENKEFDNTLGVVASELIGFIPDHPLGKENIVAVVVFYPM